MDHRQIHEGEFFLKDLAEANDVLAFHILPGNHHFPFPKILQDKSGDRHLGEATPFVGGLKSGRAKGEVPGSSSVSKQGLKEAPRSII